MASDQCRFDLPHAALAGIYGVFLLVFCSTRILAQETYCNPLDLDYTYMIYNAHDNLSYRSGADPAVVQYRGEYYMFVTRSMGYWHSPDLTTWRFITPENWYFEGSNAPAAFNFRDSVLYVAGHPSGSMNVIYTEHPDRGRWEATQGLLHNLQDPALFIDEDGKSYMYWGSSNTFPIKVRELDRNKRFRPSETIHELFGLNGKEHGWERFGEDHRDTIPGYIEGPWMNRIGDTYYLQYAAPGTEFNVYADGAYTASHPLGPFTYMPNNPFSYKPGGFMNGAGHGSTVPGPGGQHWHFASMALNVNVGWERRIGAFPAFVDGDGLLHCDTRFGDYPHFAPSESDRQGAFAGWMLLSYGKPVTVSSAVGDFKAEYLTDEKVKTFWLASPEDQEPWVRIDLQRPMEVRALQINYNDYQSNMYGRPPAPGHQFLLEGSLDGVEWITLEDRSETQRDAPNAYIQLERPARCRYVRYRNIHVPTPHLSISDFRIFGLGGGKLPGVPSRLQADRSADRLDVQLHWKEIPGVQGYNVLWGIAPDKLYNSWMVYGKADLELRALTAGQAYYIAVEAFNENGVSAPSKPQFLE